MGRGKRQTVVLGAEMLERRNLMAANVTIDWNPSTKFLKILGTAESDQISVAKTARGIEVTATTLSYDTVKVPVGGSIKVPKIDVQSKVIPTDVARIEIRGGGGNDVLRIDEAWSSYQRADLYGGSGNDVVWGGGGADWIWGDDGADELYGRGGSDELQGGKQNDILSGGAGIDRLFGQEGNDHLYGNRAIERLDGGKGVNKIHSELPASAATGSWRMTRPGLQLDRQLDLTESAVAKKLEEKLLKLAQGNEDEAKVKSLSLDLETGDATGSFSIRHRHVWKVMGRKVTAYDDRMSGDFTFNVFSQEIGGTIDLGRGVKLDLHELYKVVQGDLTPLYAASFAARQRSDYADDVSRFREQYGPGNVYFASKTFVDWAGPETLARWGAEAVASEGTSLSSVPAEVANKLRSELTGITQWLGSRVEDPVLAESIAKKLSDALASRSNVDSPYLSVRWTKVGYWYESAVLPGVKTQSLNHAAFAVILKI